MKGHKRASMNRRQAVEKRILVPQDDSLDQSRDISSDYLWDLESPTEPDNHSASLLSRDELPKQHMILTPRRLRRIIRNAPIFKLARYVVILVVVLIVATPIIAPSYTNPPSHYRELNARCATLSSKDGCANRFREKVFISVSLYDKNGHLASGSWGKALLELVDIIGPENAFVSIYENDSGPDGARELENLKRRLPCRHRVVNDAHVPLTGFPTITMPDGKERIKRLAYLSEMRNRALRPLDAFNETELGVSVGGGGFDKILFLNDVDFHPTDAANLLFSTHVGTDGRTNYLAACGLDFMQPVLFYDLYAQRDAEGFSGGIPIFPFFSTEGQGISRAAILAQSDAVPVKSCWGGIVAMQAKYVQNLDKELPATNFQEIGSHVIDPTSPQNVTAPVRFRNEPEIFFDACECCLFHADVSQAARNAGAEELGTYVNPYVRVAYSQSTLGWLPWIRRWERLFTIPQWLITKIAGLPTYNPHRTVQEGKHFTEEIWTGPQPGNWQLTERIGRNGLFCGVREMQLVQTADRTEDKNWENNKMPPGQVLHFPT